MSSFKVAAIQLNSQPDLGHNLDQIRPLLEKATENGARLAALPENFAFYGNDREQLSRAEEISGRVEAFIAECSAEFGINILGGGYPVPADGEKAYNRSVLVDSEGKTAAAYDKIHLFDVTISDTESYLESDIIKPGKNVTVYEAKGLPKIGFSICYDVRFPELYRRMADQGAELITVPSAFTKTTGKSHWEVLLRARAIENSSYLVAPAQTGTHGDARETYGHSLIIDPWGNVLADAGTEPGIITADINLDYLEEVRKKLPSLKHRVLPAKT